MARRRSRRKLPPTIRLPPLYRRNPLALTGGIALLALALLGRFHRAPSSPVVTGNDYHRYHNHVFTVVNVVDGDTIDIDAPDGRRNTTRIRLWGVDTPEVAGSPTGERYWGPEASAFAKSTLLNTRVRLELLENNTRDKYKRLLAYVYLTSPEQMFNEMLVRQGHAYADTRFEHPHLAGFRSLESDARSARIGLWRHVTSTQMPNWRRRQKRR